jgi:hypothetical protein
MVRLGPVTRQQISRLRPGQWVQEVLGGRRRPPAKPQWGRPREVVGVDLVWDTRRGKAVHFRVAFGLFALHWTAVEEDGRYRVALEPAPAELEAWAASAEKSQVVFKE